MDISSAYCGKTCQKHYNSSSLFGVQLATKTNLKPDIPCLQAIDLFLNSSKLPSMWVNQQTSCLERFTLS